MVSERGISRECGEASLLGEHHHIYRTVFNLLGQLSKAPKGPVHFSTDACPIRILTPHSNPINNPKIKTGLKKIRPKHLTPQHGCCWDTFFIFAFCGLVVEIPTLQKFVLLLPFRLQPSQMGMAQKTGTKMGCSVKWKHGPQLA